MIRIVSSFFLWYRHNTCIDGICFLFTKAMGRLCFFLLFFLKILSCFQLFSPRHLLLFCIGGMSIVTETKNLYTAGLVYSLDQKLKISQLKSGDFPQDLDTQALESWMQELGCQLCVQGMPNYHYKFSTIRSAPYLVYFLGDLALLDKSLCGIVGPRAMSPYGDRVIQDLFGTMQAYDCATVSGLADGVDTLTHELSLERGIPTIAVL